MLNKESTMAYFEDWLEEAAMIYPDIPKSSQSISHLFSSINYEQK